MFACPALWWTTLEVPGEHLLNMVRAALDFTAHCSCQQTQKNTLLCLVWILERAVAETGSPLQISFASDNYTVKVDNESLGPLHGCTIKLKVATHLGVQLLVRMTSVSSTTFGGLSKHRLSVTFLQPTLLGRVQQGMKTSLCSAPAAV